MNQRAIIVGAFPGSVVTFRGDLIRALVAAGVAVTVMTADSDRAVKSEIESLGVSFRSFRIRRNSIAPLDDLRTWLDLRRAFQELQPGLILAYTIKPVIWGGIAGRVKSKTQFFALITGLGFAFQGVSFKRRLLSKVVKFLYKMSLSRASAVIFQNPDDREVFIKNGIVPRDKCFVVNGSGVNVHSFPFCSLPEGHPRFLLIARLLGEKGIREYVQAARIVKDKWPEVEFQLVGPEDPSPDAIPLAEVLAWQAEGVITYCGATRDVRPFLQSCHVYCLPSYHEGMPRTVLEAMAAGRPILTTDVSGCKETVEPGLNGWLVPKGDPEALAERMVWFLENRHQWPMLGRASRQIAEEKFDVSKVNLKMLRILGIE